MPQRRESVNQKRAQTARAKLNAPLAAGKRQRSTSWWPSLKSKLAAKSSLPSLIRRAEKQDQRNEATLFNGPLVEDLDTVPSWLTPFAIQPADAVQVKDADIEVKPLRSFKGSRSRLYQLIFGPQSDADVSEFSSPASKPATALRVTLSSARSPSMSVVNSQVSSPTYSPVNSLAKSLDNLLLSPKTIDAVKPKCHSADDARQEQSRQRKSSQHSVKETSLILHVTESPELKLSTQLQQLSPIANASTGLPFDVIQAVHNLSQLEGMVNEYALIKEIGDGSFSKVWLVYNVDLKRYFACKCVSKKRLRKMGMWRTGPQRKRTATVGSKDDTPSMPQFDYMEFVRREIAILKKLSHHPNIATLHEVLDDQKYDTLYMVFDLCEYGSVMHLPPLNSTVTYQCFSEPMARRYFRDIVMGLKYLHAKGIVHRDLKVDNILLTADNHCVIGDFGISFSMSMAGNMGSGNGILTPILTPPEMVDTLNQIGHSAQKQADVSMDIWSLGITLYCLLHGRPPFHAATLPELYQQIMAEPQSYGGNLSSQCTNLLDRLLDRNKLTRITLPDVGCHSWVTDSGRDDLPVWQVHQDQADILDDVPISRLLVT